MSASELRPMPDTHGARASDALLSDADRLSLLRYMLMMRLAEERGLNLYKQGKIPGSFYDGLGQEAISVGAAFALAPADRACILHRDLGAHFVRGLSPDRYLANCMGRSGGVTGGKDGNMHFGDPELGCVGMVSMLPDMAPVTCGLALAFKMRREPRVAMTFFGDGSTANGQWHEAMTMAGVQQLPVVFVLENNQFAYSTPNEGEFVGDPIERAAGYGFAAAAVDGNDVEAVFAAATEAADRARGGGGPTLISCETMRMHGHAAHDDMRYVPEALVERWRQRDPIELYRGRLQGEHGLERGALDALEAEVRELIEHSTEQALASPLPEPQAAAEGVFAEQHRPLGDGQAPWSRWSGSAERRAAAS